MEDNKISIGKQQILQSKGQMDFIIRSTSDQITQIKLDTEKLEKERKLREAEKREKRLRDIQEESFQCSTKMGALEIKWSKMRGIEECETLQKEINNQFALFKEVRKAKDDMIEQFQEDLKKKEDDYTKMLKRQSIDVDQTIKNMRSQFFEVREQYLCHLEKIMKEFENERGELLNNQENEIQVLFNKHQSMERDFVTQRDERELEYARQIETLRIEGAKTYTDYKISMETDIQNIVKCFEDMRALFQLNTEKLEYNLTILKEKNEESLKLKDEKKRKDHDLTEYLRGLNKTYVREDESFKKENKQITLKYKQIAKQFKELQKKVKHFEKADTDRYNEIQKMNEAEVQTLKEKIIKCDITIHVQQLGMPWIPQQEDEEQNEQQNSVQQMKDQSTQEQNNMISNSGGNQKQEQQVLELNDDQLKEIVDMIIEETDFLIDDKVRDLISKSSEEEALLIKMEQLKKCMNIDSIDEMNMLFQFLYEKQFEKKQFINRLEQENQSEVEEENNENIVNNSIHEQLNEDEQELDMDMSTDSMDIKNQMIDYLLQFINNKDARKATLDQMNKKKAIIQETQKEKKERIAREGKKYWEKLTQVLPEKTLKVWMILDKQLSKYYSLLLERQKYIDETGELHNQNEELKNLLNQYLQINHELIIPPTRLIKLEQNNESTNMNPVQQ